MRNRLKKKLAKKQREKGFMEFVFRDIFNTGIKSVITDKVIERFPDFSEQQRQVIIDDLLKKAVI